MTTTLRKALTDTAYVAIIYSKWATRYPIHYISVPMLLPFGTFFSLAFIISPANRLYAVSGPIVFAVTLTTVLYIGQWVGHDKLFNRLSLFATLPVSPLSYGMGIALSAAFNSVISTALILALGVVTFHLQPLWSWVLLIPAFLASFGVGTAIGFLIANSSSDFRVISSTAQIVAFTLSLFAPAFYPIEVIPYPLRYVSLLIPTTYSAFLVRDSLGGDVGSFGMHVIPLIAMGVVLFVIVALRVSWRSK